MKKAGFIILCCVVGARAFVVPPPLRSAPPRLNTGRLGLPAVGQEGADQVTVFDAGEVPLSWDDYEKQKPNEYKVGAKRSRTARQLQK